MGIFDFNPHFHKGSDSSEYLQQYIDRYFNPHFHKGSDSAHSSPLHPLHYFNPHFHKGSDPDNPDKRLVPLHFNPHFHKGSDSSFSFSTLFIFISIHTSTREVTTGAKSLMDCKSISIHTSTREVTAIFHKNICLFL